MLVTAKVRLGSKIPVESDGDNVALTFMADYENERNKEWAKYTPALSLNMYVLKSVADKFEYGTTYTLTFEKDE